MNTWNRTMILFFLKMYFAWKLNYFCWYFDASGDFIPKVKAQPLLYSIFSHDTENKNIIPFKEFLTTKHESINMQFIFWRWTQQILITQWKATVLFSDEIKQTRFFYTVIYHWKTRRDDFEVSTTFNWKRNNNTSSCSFWFFSNRNKVFLKIAQCFGLNIKTTFIQCCFNVDKKRHVGTEATALAVASVPTCLFFYSEQLHRQRDSP